MMVNFLLRLENMVHNHLNEYVKWVLVLGLYVFYRMLEKLYDEKQLVFLVVPILFISICIFISNRIISALINFFRINSKEMNLSSRKKTKAILIGSLFFLSILSLIGFYFYEHVSLINFGFFSLLTSGLVPFLFKSKKARWSFWIACILLVLGIAGFIHSVIMVNALNTISFIFYLTFLIFYFLTISLIQKQEAREED